jgi:hypothetical protein
VEVHLFNEFDSEHFPVSHASITSSMQNSISSFLPVLQRVFILYYIVQSRDVDRRSVLKLSDEAGLGHHFQQSKRSMRYLKINVSRTFSNALVVVHVVLCNKCIHNACPLIMLIVVEDVSGWSAENRAVGAIPTAGPGLVSECSDTLLN